MDFTNLISLGFNYLRNRNNQKKRSWNKAADSQAIFDEMERLGMYGCSATCGFFTGMTEDRVTYALAVNDNSVQVGVLNDINDFFCK